MRNGRYGRYRRLGVDGLFRIRLGRTVINAALRGMFRDCVSHRSKCGRVWTYTLTPSQLGDMIVLLEGCHVMNIPADKLDLYDRHRRRLVTKRVVELKTAYQEALDDGFSA